MSNPRTALLMLDYQVALVEEGPHLKMPPLAEQVRERDVLATAARVLDHARSQDWLVIHVRLAFDPSYVLRTNRLPRFDPYENNRVMLRDSPEAQIVKQVAPIDGEAIVDKGAVDPFVGTPLLNVLAAEGVGTVVLGGVATNLVVESAARHASDAGLQVTIVEDMCASFKAEFHEFSMTNILPFFGQVTSADELIGTSA